MKLKRTVSHALLMAACFAAMLIAVLALTSSTIGGSWGFYLLILLCPAMHLMMQGKMYNGEDRDDKPKAQLPASKAEVPSNKRAKLSG